MLKYRVFWNLAMGGMIGFWFLVVFFGFVGTFEHRIIARTVFGLLIVLHFLEIFIARQIAREQQLSEIRIVLKTLVFGLFWWVPLQRGIIGK